VHVLNGSNVLLEPDELHGAVVELCQCGLLTCTRGEPGSNDATYAVAWLPLDDPEDYSQAVRDQHAENMRRLNAEKV
jgi:hypothetical protein